MLEQNALLGRQYLAVGALYLFNRGQGRPVVAGGHVDLDQIVVDFVGVTRLGKLVEEPLEYPHRIVEGRGRTVIEAEGVVVERRLAHLPVVVALRGHLESHAGIVLVVGPQIGLPDVEVGILRQGIVGAGHPPQVVDGLGIVALPVGYHSQGIERRTLGVAGALQIAFEVVGSGLVVTLLIGTLAE